MRAGELRHLITIQQATESRTASGAVSKSWSTFTTAYADIKPMDGREYFQVDQETAEARVKFVIRYQAGITTAMRISWDGNFYDIESTLNTGSRDRSIQIIAIQRGV